MRRRSHPGERSATFPDTPLPRLSRIDAVEPNRYVADDQRVSVDDPGRTCDFHRTCRHTAKPERKQDFHQSETKR